MWTQFFCKINHMDKKYIEVDPFDWITCKQSEYEKEWLESGGDKDAVDFFHSGMSLNDEDDKDFFNPRKAIKFFKLSSELGYAPAMDEYGSLISDIEEDVEHDIDKVIAQFEKAASLGYIPAYSSLAQIYEDGIGVEQDTSKAIEMYTVCAEANSPFDQYFLAHILDYQLGKSKEAEYWYSKAVAGSLCPAVMELGNMYYFGRGQGTYMLPDSEPFAVDYFRAFSCFVLAYKLEDDSALRHIADCYFYGRGVKVDKNAAITMYIEAADKDSLAADNIGEIYMTGNGVAQNVEMAIRYWKHGAELGNSECMRELGDFFKFGETGDEDENVFKEYIDYKQALYWYQRGAELDDEYCKSEIEWHNKGEW